MLSELEMDMDMSVRALILMVPEWSLLESVEFVEVF
jgi:hypothetical protein